jgi:hypothetical protein
MPRQTTLSIRLPQVQGFSEFYFKSGTLNMTGLKQVIADYAQVSAHTIDIEHTSTSTSSSILVKGNGLGNMRFHISALLTQLNLTENDCAITCSYILK